MLPARMCRRSKSGWPPWHRLNHLRRPFPSSQIRPRSLACWPPRHAMPARALTCSLHHHRPSGARSASLRRVPWHCWVKSMVSRFAFSSIPRSKALIACLSALSIRRSAGTWPPVRSRAFDSKSWRSLQADRRSILTALYNALYAPLPARPDRARWEVTLPCCLKCAQIVHQKCTTEARCDRVRCCRC